MQPTQNLRLAVPFFMVSNVDASLEFYVEKLGFKITNQWEPRGRIEWCWLQRDSVSIMLQGPYNRDTPRPETPQGKGISICFQCTDALALYHEFTAKGITIPEPFVGNGLWVVCFPDPDGYKLDFESPTDVEEETTYSDWLKGQG